MLKFILIYCIIKYLSKYQKKKEWGEKDEFKSSSFFELKNKNYGGKKLKIEFKDEKNGISYTLVGNYYVPNLVLKQEEKVILNKYGRLRLNYLKEHKKAEYTILFMEGQLNNKSKK